MELVRSDRLYVTVMTPMHYGDDHYMSSFICSSPWDQTYFSKLFLIEMGKLDNMQTQNVRFIKWCNVGLQNVTVLTLFAIHRFNSTPCIICWGTKRSLPNSD